MSQQIIVQVDGKEVYRTPHNGTSQQARQFANREQGLAQLQYPGKEVTVLIENNEE